MSWDALYYYYKPEYLDLVADSFNCAAWEPYLTRESQNPILLNIQTVKKILRYPYCRRDRSKNEKKDLGGEGRGGRSNAY